MLFIIAAFYSCKNSSESNTNTDADNPTIEKEAAHQHKDSTEAEKEELVITSKQYKAAGIELGKAVSAGLSESIKATGTLDVPPQNYAEVSTYIGGIIKTINSIEGDHVTKGQTIMTLEHPDFIKLQEEYTSIRSNMSFYKKEYERQKELYDENVSSGKIFQEAESKFNAEKGRLASVESQLSMIGISTSDLDNGKIAKVVSLRSPINGFIANIHGSIGSYAEPNKMLFDVIDNERIHVHLDVYERDVYKIKVGQKVSVTLPNQDNNQVEARIFNIGKALNNTTKSIAIHADIINNKHRELIPGVFVNAVIHAASNEVFAVPSEAVIRSGEKQYVFIVNDQLVNSVPPEGMDPYSVKDSKGNMIPLAYRMIEVTTGTEDKGMMEIHPVKQIASTDQLVVKGAYYLMSALKSGETVGCCAPAEEEKKE